MEKPARQDAEYVLAFDFPPWAKTPAEVLVPKDTVVVNVRYKPTGAALQRAILGGATELEFTVKETGKAYTTNYGSMFVLRTPENLEKLAVYREARLEEERAKKRTRKLWKGLDTVGGPFEGTFAAASEQAS